MPPRVTLLLQGPVGPFFAGLARELRRRGDVVHHVVLNGGDRFFAGRDGVIAYTGDRAGWRSWLERRIADLGVDRVILFGEYRTHHREALALCRALGVPAWVCEEGYLRPHYLTLECGGVNANSPLPRDPGSWLAMPAARAMPEPRGYGAVMLRRVLTCIAYYVALAWGARTFRGYRHHRRTSLVRESGAWLRALWRRVVHAVAERDALARIGLRPTFLLPLQVEGDHQISEHSPFASVAASLAHVVRSFAAHAPPDAALVIKHHPMDRGYRDYGRLIAALGRRWRLGDRLVYLHDTPVPVLLRRTLGVVTVNSTVGLSALCHGVPVKVLGRALYDLPGLTHRGGLDGFWTWQQPADRRLFAVFHEQLRLRTQLNACTASAASTWDLLDRLDDFAAAPAAARPAVAVDAAPEVAAVA